MSVKILIPTALRQFSKNKDTIELTGENVGEIFYNLTNQYPDLKKHLFNDKDQLRNFVNVYVNDEDIRYLEKTDTKVKSGDVISIVPSIAGGSETRDSGTQNDESFSREEIERYSRHLIMPEVALEGQRRLKNANVLIIGMGGLGSPLSMYLAAAGIGRMGIVDFDVVDFTNLQRQVIYSIDNVGHSKLESARKRLEGINPHIRIDTHEKRLTSENALDLFGNYDIIIDGTDNFPTRYLVNDACVLLGKPNVYGSIFRFEGQVSVFYAKEGPCYRCLYPEPPPPGLVPSCAEGGVLGILPGTIGLLQATEAVKLILGKGRPLIGRLLLYDALEATYRELNLKKDPNCPICGENPSIHSLIDYDEFCGIGNDIIELEPEYEISVKELDQEIRNNGDTFILDVREFHEYEMCRIPNAKLIPLNNLATRINELDRSWDIVLYCRTGVRSAKALKFLREAGFQNVKNLVGGISAWSDEVDPTVPKY